MTRDTQLLTRKIEERGLTGRLMLDLAATYTGRRHRAPTAHGVGDVEAMERALRTMCYVLDVTVNECSTLHGLLYQCDRHQLVDLILRAVAFTGATNYATLKLSF